LVALPRATYFPLYLFPTTKSPHTTRQRHHGQPKGSSSPAGATSVLNTALLDFNNQIIVSSDSMDVIWAIDQNSGEEVDDTVDHEAIPSRTPESLNALIADPTNVDNMNEEMDIVAPDNIEQLAQSHGMETEHKTPQPPGSAPPKKCQNAASEQLEKDQQLGQQLKMFIKRFGAIQAELKIPARRHSYTSTTTRFAGEPIAFERFKPVVPINSSLMHAVAVKNPIEHGVPEHESEVPKKKKRKHGKRQNQVRRERKERELAEAYHVVEPMLEEIVNEAVGSENATIQEAPFEEVNALDVAGVDPESAREVMGQEVAETPIREAATAQGLQGERLNNLNLEGVSLAEVIGGEATRAQELPDEPVNNLDGVDRDGETEDEEAYQIARSKLFRRPKARDFFDKIKDD
jgi:hypothetical protein